MLNSPRRIIDSTLFDRSIESISASMGGTSPGKAATVEAVVVVSVVTVVVVEAGGALLGSEGLIG